MVFRSLLNYSSPKYSYMSNPHSITKVVVEGENKCSKIKIEDDSPIIDPRLSANWTDISELGKNGVNIQPITQYISSSLESRLSALNEGVALLNADMEFVRNSKVEPTPEPTPEPNV